MIIVVDIGNSNIAIGGVDEETIHFTARLSTDRKKTDVEYAIDIKNTLDIFGFTRDQVNGCIVSSVVPQITNSVKRATKYVFGGETMVLKPGLRTGLNICMDNPGELGADRVADAVAAVHEYPLPLAIVDMGSATTISVVDEAKRFIGGTIFPGVRVALDALTERASMLSGISLEIPDRVIGRNTTDCMRSGVLYGNASVIDGIISRMEEELGKALTVIATGGNSRAIVPYCRHQVIHDENLLLKGLMYIYKKNV